MLGFLLLSSSQNPFFACLKAMGLIPANCLTAPCGLVSCGLIQEALVGFGERELVFSSWFCSLSLELAASLRDLPV